MEPQSRAVEDGRPLFSKSRRIAWHGHGLYVTLEPWKRIPRLHLIQDGLNCIQIVPGPCALVKFDFRSSVRSNPESPIVASARKVSDCK